MIRYALTRRDLEARVESVKAGWLEKARTRTRELELLRRFEEGALSWSDIKAAFLAVQNSKCAYCERKLESPGIGSIEHDVEHYRPKSSVEVWPTAKLKRRLAYGFSLGAKANNGYYLLAYEILNYATACKVCNSILKKNYFPVKGTRVLSSGDFGRLASEEPYLLYPIDKVDVDDPEKLITFNGYLPIPNPRLRSAHKRNRARVTIDFFQLDLRDTLLEERSRIILAVWLALETLREGSAADRNIRAARRVVEIAASPASPHTNCARSFIKAYERDRDEAALFVDQADAYLESRQTA